MSDGFIPIISIFYAVFHPIEGTKIVHQFPPNLIATSKKKANVSTGVEAGPGEEEQPQQQQQQQQEKEKEKEKEEEKEEEEEEEEREERDEETNEFSNENSQSLFDFDTVKNYVIPKPQLCNRLISFKIDKLKVIGYPVHMVNEQYARNSFSFNFCFVFSYETGDVKPYESAIRRMGHMFGVLEEQNRLLSKLDKDNSFYKSLEQIQKEKKSSTSLNSANLDVFGVESLDNRLNEPGHAKTKEISLSSIESLITQIYQDLNNYSECCIPLDNSNSVDIKLFPILPAPVNLKAFQVPIATVKLRSLVDVNWYPTMVKILPYIDGVNSLKRISELADADYLITKQCIQHLMHYKCIEIVDIFQFNNIYAPTNRIGEFLKSDGKIAEQCQAYVVANDDVRQSPSAYTPMNHYHHQHNHSPKAFSEVASTTSSSPGYFKHIPSGSMSPYSKNSYLSTKSPGNFASAYLDIKIPTKTDLFFLYRSLNQGQTVKEWYLQHKNLFHNIDVRRFINFGVLRGLIYRVYSYPVLNAITRMVESGELPEPEHFLNHLKRRRIERLKRLDRLESLEKRLVMRSRTEGNMRNAVNEQTLVTEPRRRVSFASVVDKNGKRTALFGHGNTIGNTTSTVTNRPLNEAIAEDESELSNSDDDDDDEEGEGGGGGGGGARKKFTIPKPLSNPLLKRAHRFSSSSNLYENNDQTQTIGGDEGEGEGESEGKGADGDEDVMTEQEEEEMTFLIKMLIGFQHFDSICTELQKSRSEVEEMIKRFGSFTVVNS